MAHKRVVMVIDMQNGVFGTPRYHAEQCIARINSLTEHASEVIFIQHEEAGCMDKGTQAFALLPGVIQPTGAHYVTKTACDAFWHTPLESLLRERGITAFTVCGCATEYCLDTTIRQAAGLGFVVTVASDAHTTSDRPAASADVLIAHHNDIWRNFTVPGNPVYVRSTAEILSLP